MKILLAGLMILHGIAHGVGFMGAWRLGKDIPYKTTVLAGRLDLGDSGIRVMGVLWLLAGIAFVLAGVAAMMNRVEWTSFAFLITLVSFGLCVVELPEAKVGLALNVVLIVALLTVMRLQLF